jgi:hypothetical protein
VTVREIEIVAVFTAIAAMWRQVAALLDWPRRLLIVHRDVQGETGSAIMSYLLHAASSRPSDGGCYRSDYVHVKPLGRTHLVFSETMVISPAAFWLRRRPIWFRQEPGLITGNYISRFRYIRGTLDWERFLLDVANWTAEQVTTESGMCRFTVRVHGGDGSPDQNGVRAPTSNGGVPTATARDVSGEYLLTRRDGGNRIIHWSQADIGLPPPMPIESLSLRPEISELVEDVRRFVAAREWFSERGIPWRRGWLAHGAPGTGKTSVVRALATEHDLPVHVFDLGSLGNHSFRDAWSQMLAHAPCIALIEDIDAVFEGRDNRTEGAGPTFDCVINCIGGISACDGVLLFVTTNRQESIDPALRRGGRLDMEVEFLRLDRAGRWKMARRILGSEADADAIADDALLAELSPADLQEHLCRRAIAGQFGAAA